MTRKEAIKVLENRTQYFVSVQDLVALNMAIEAMPSDGNRLRKCGGVMDELFAVARYWNIQYR